MSIAIAKQITCYSPLPVGWQLIGWIDRHPATGVAGYGVIRHTSGREVAWDGQAMRSLPLNWRHTTTFEAAD